ncbi:MAG: hypothetical protein JST87_12440 [Bacteroidetes bacterium]|nr:hypothetical protein [Bacteroidota bacterium]MBS1934278.1 hypothetical protein [Bacteroidota bacterium]
MKSIIQDLIFDKEIVQEIKKVKIENGQLYNLLIAGKITLKEYLNAQE